MGSVNRAFLVGNLGRDAEMRYTKDGTAVAGFSLATTETWKDRQGEKQERTEWHNCSLWGKAAEAVQQYLTKGKQVCVEGRIQTDEYTDRDGIKRKATKIRVDRLTLLGGGGGDREGGRRRARENDGAGDGGGYETPATDLPPLDDSDIPF